MGFIDAGALGFIKVFDFSSRSSRLEFWAYTVFIGVISFVGHFTEYLVFGKVVLENMALGKETFTSSLLLVTLVPQASLVVRRLHDVNRSAWWWLVLFIPSSLIPLVTLNELWWLFWFISIGLIPLIYWVCFKKGDEKKNNYGSNPLLEDSNPELEHLKTALAVFVPKLKIASLLERLKTAETKK